MCGQITLYSKPDPSGGCSGEVSPDPHRPDPQAAITEPLDRAFAEHRPFEPDGRFFEWLASYQARKPASMLTCSDNQPVVFAGLPQHCMVDRKP